METKICNKCKSVKSISEYYKDKTKKDGLTTFCILCKKESNKSLYSNNKDVRLKKSREYREKNRDTIIKKSREYYKNNKVMYNEKAKIYRELNPEKIIEMNKEYYNNHKDEIMNRYIKNRDEELIRMKNWKKSNRVKLAKYQKEYYQKRKLVDPLFKLQHNIRTLIRLSIARKGIRKNTRTNEILCCSFEEFKLHLESKFEPWMNWDNYGQYNGTKNYGWDIDHIIPTCKATCEDELILLNLT